jgi:cation:H+ antiporter
MMDNLLIFVFSLLLVVKGATLATRSSAKLAENFHLPKHILGFFIVAMISILPETLISINSALEGNPEFGLGTLFGSNVADLTLIFAILIIYAKRGIKIESKVLKDIHLYPFFLLLPLLFGLNGHYSRIEGAALIIAGGIFYYMVSRNGLNASAEIDVQENGVQRLAHLFRNEDNNLKHFSLLLLSMALLLLGSHFTVTSATTLAHSLNITPILIGMLVVSLGTTMPELFYSLKSVERDDDELAIGDIMGSVLADATIVVGILSFISPFAFPIKIVYITGLFMVVASLILLYFMQSEKIITKKEGYALLAFWILYAIVELIMNS